MKKRILSMMFVVVMVVTLLPISAFATYEYNWSNCGRRDVTAEFLNKVESICNQLGANPDDLMAVMEFESGLDHTSVNPTSGATGLIQFMPSTASNLGTSTSALKAMTAVQQLDYVYKYFQPYKGRISNIGDLYMAVL